MIDVRYLPNINTEFSRTIDAAWILFFDESLDAVLRVAILQQAVKIRIGKIMLEKDFRPNQIKINNYGDCLICGEEAYNMLK
jgi:hypothetical protein